MTSDNRWIKATASNDNGSCVEMRRQADLIEVRDTKDGGAGPILRFSTGQFSNWLGGAKTGKFDHLVR